MSHYSQDGIYNPAYHDTETLEFQRSPSRGTHHYNPYDSYLGPRERTALDFMPPDMLPPYVDREVVPGQQSWTTTDSLVMRPLFPQHENKGFQHNQRSLRSQLYMGSSVDYATSFHDQRPPGTLQMGNVSMRRRGTLSTSLFPGGGAALGKLGLTEEDIIDEIENEEHDLVKELVSMSTRERIQAIRNLPLCFEDKKNVRNHVLATKSSKRRHRLTCCSDCSEKVSLFLRRCSGALATARQAIPLWQNTMKEIGGKFGTSVLSYFIFLKWLLMFNIFSFLVNFGFITIPRLIQGSNLTNCVGFRGLELITGAGYFHQTVMYYGAYNSGTIGKNLQYNTQLAYFFTLAAYLVLCTVLLIYSMVRSFQKNFVLSDVASGSSWRLLCSWDFSIVSEKAVRQTKNNLCIQLKESLSENRERKLLSPSETMKKLAIHLCAWLLSIGLAVCSCTAIYYLSQYSFKPINPGNVEEEASTLLLPFVVSLFNLVIPLLCSLLSQMEHFSNPRYQIYVVIIRNVLLKMSILGILCYHWMNNVAKSNLQCWESFVGEELYRLVIVDFFFLLIGSLFGEFLRRIIGTKLMPKLGIPEFDVARNVLDLIYAQTLAWIGIYFSPLLPVMQIIKFFILFYVKKISLSQNCQPPRRSGRAAQMQTVFIVLLFIPSFVGALSMLAYTVWSLKPSDICGPFQGLNNTFKAVSNWIEIVDVLKISWVVWIYNKMIKSELFFFLLSLIALVLIYIFWQITQGRKLLIILLKEQIVNEGKDKAFLLDKLKNLQNINNSQVPHQLENAQQPKNLFQPHHGRQQSETCYSNAYQGPPGVEEETASPSSSALLQAMLARHQAEEEEY
ncbi:transmembrane channel-like protein 5 [Arapaima gigas]